MNNDELRSDIADQISKTSQSLNGIWSKKYLDGLKSKDILSREAMLKKVSRDYKYNSILSITITSVVVLYSILQYFDFVDFFDMDKAGLIIMIAFLLLINTFRLYKLKVNLEHNIYLGRLLDKIGGK